MATRLLVGSDWVRCPCCNASYAFPDSHHPACPIQMSAALCQFCASVHNHPHLPGCPETTGLYPVLGKELDAGLECACCSTRFKLGECFVAGESAILCVGCAWIESAEIVNIPPSDLEPSETDEENSDEQ